MTRYLIQLISRLSLVCICIVLLAAGIGRLLPAEPELLFTASFNLKDLNIYRMSVTRQMTVAITHNFANDFLPNWSPDGQHIAFVSDRDGNYSIYLTDADGHNTHRLTEGTDNQYSPEWSPDGKYIAYINERGGYGAVMLYDLAAGTTQALTDSYHTHVSPVWTPDGKSITFVSDLDQQWNTRVYSVDIISHDITPILVGSASNPVWSPDGRYLLYITGYEKVYLYLWDTTSQKATLFYDGSFAANDTPAWSADGHSILFSAFTTTNYSGIFQLPVAECIARSSACLPQALITIPAFYRSPQWKPTQPISHQ